MNTHRRIVTRLLHSVPLLATLLLPSCAHRVSVPQPPAAPVLPAPKGLRVTLTWVGAADLDLYVTGPSWETVYFGNTPSRSGGTLERDARCGDVAPAKDRDPMVEWTTFADPEPGHYRVGVDYLEGCGGPTDPQSFRLVVEYGNGRHEQIGMVQHHEFNPIVLEFALRTAEGSEPPTLVIDHKPEVKP